jgi:Cyclic nucleotide-binding domain
MATHAVNPRTKSVVIEFLESLRWQDWAGNACYTLLALSYLFTNMFWLRALAIVSLAFEAVYFYYGAASPLWVGIGWNAIFVAINLVMLILLFINERTRRRYNHDEVILKRSLFTDLDGAQFTQLLNAGQWQDVKRGTVLTTQRAPVDTFFVIADGMAEVEVDGRIIAILQNGAFVGEMSLMTDEPASATVTAIANCRLFALEKLALGKLLAKNPELQRELTRIIGRDLSRKLRSTSSLPIDVSQFGRQQPQR